MSRILALCLVLAMPAAHASVEQKVGTFNGLEVTYRVVLPDGYDTQKAYPVILHFAGGGQTISIVERSVDADWRRNAERRGYIVISPAAPGGELYFEGGARIFPAFIDYILRTYKVQGGKLHVTGQSNGGLSAFHLATLYPQYFRSVTGYPGLFGTGDDARLDGLKGLCVYMHVGDQDPSWLTPMRRQQAVLVSKGIDVRFRIEADQPHRLDSTKANLADRLFDEIAASASGACG